MKCSKCGLELAGYYDFDQKQYLVHPGAAMLEVCLMKQGIIKKLVVREEFPKGLGGNAANYNPMMACIHCGQFPCLCEATGPGEPL